MKLDTESLWEPPPRAGKLVAVTQWKGDIIIACEYCIFRMKSADSKDVVVEEVRIE